MTLSDKKIERLVRASELYYEENKTQSEIAEIMGISRPMVSVLLSEAKSSGIVTITINHAQGVQELMEQKLKERYGLERAIVVKTSGSGSAVNGQVARAAYEFCFSDTHKKTQIGVGWGSMIGFMAEYAESLDVKPFLDGSIVPLIGGIGASYRSYHTNEIVRVFSGVTGLEADYFYMPAFFESVKDKETAMQLESFHSIEEKWNNLQSAVMNISNFPSYPDLNVKYRFGNKLVTEKAVGRILAYYYNENGTVIDAQVSNELQISMAQLKRIPRVTAVASMQVQPSAVIGALNLHVITDLILPDKLAALLCE